MSFSRLYDDVQSQTRVSTNWLTQRAIRYSTITRVKEQWSSILDQTVLRGVYIEGPIGPPVPLGENEALIILPREMCTGHLGAHWRRFIKAKELMHVFDLPEEKAGTEELFDQQVEKFGNPGAPTTSQFLAESKAFWRALAVLCPEAQRLGFKEDLIKERKSFDVVAAALRIPAVHVRSMMRNDFETIVEYCKRD